MIESPANEELSVDPYANHMAFTCLADCAGQGEANPRRASRRICWTLDGAVGIWAGSIPPTRDVSPGTPIEITHADDWNWLTKACVAIPLRVSGDPQRSLGQVLLRIVFLRTGGTPGYQKPIRRSRSTSPDRIANRAWGEAPPPASGSFRFVLRILTQL